jgi:DNA repair protein RecO (recombination protein O)
MSRSRVYTTQAIVLRRTDYGEADRLLTLITPQLGKLRVIAKGARKITSRKAGHIELFTRTQLLLAKGRTFDIVSQAELIETYPVLRADMTRGSLAHYFCELIDQFAQEGNTEANAPGGAHSGDDDALFNLLEAGLRWLCTAPDPKLAARLFEMQLLSQTGYRPELFRCAQTQAPLEIDQPQTKEQTPAQTPTHTAFSPQAGGTLCAAAARLAREAVLLTPSAVLLLRVLQTRPFDEVRALHVSANLHGQLERAMQRYLNFVLERAPKSALLLKQLQG